MPDPAEARSLPDQGGRDHWLCPGCGTFDGPISYRRCDACEDRPEVRGLVGRGALDVACAARDRLYVEVTELREENERLRKFAESAAAAFHDLDYETGYLHAKAVLARAADDIEHSGLPVQHERQCDTNVGGECCCSPSIGISLPSREQGLSDG